MESDRPLNPLHERYASAEMMRIFSAGRRYRAWRTLWIALAQAQSELGLPITAVQLAALQEAADLIDLDRVAELERETRHDVVAHLRHFAEQAPEAGGILHLGATSAFITDNTDILLLKEALILVQRRLARTVRELADFAQRNAAVPCLAYTHFQPAQLTTVGKRAALWLQDTVEDLTAAGDVIAHLRCRGAKGTTGTQASFLTLFDGNDEKVVELDRRIATSLGFDTSWPLTGQTYPRKQDSRILALLAGIGETLHKMGTDLRLLQGVGELSEPFGKSQVGSSAMAYKRNPIRAERMCGLSRRLITDAINGPLTAATQWLERSLDDSSNRRLVLTDAFLCADAVLQLAAGIAAGLTLHEEAIAARVTKELPFMVTETLLMEATKRGGNRQELHERMRIYSLEAQASLARGQSNPLLDTIAADGDFRLSREEIDDRIDPRAFTGRSQRQVESFIAEVVEPALEGLELAPLEDPRV